MLLLCIRFYRLLKFRYTWVSLWVCMCFFHVSFGCRCCCWRTARVFSLLALAIRICLPSYLFWFINHTGATYTALRTPIVCIRLSLFSDLFINHLCDKIPLLYVHDMVTHILIHIHVTYVASVWAWCRTQILLWLFALYFCVLVFVRHSPLEEQKSQMVTIRQFVEFFPSALAVEFIISTYLVAWHSPHYCIKLTWSGWGRGKKGSNRPEISKCKYHTGSGITWSVTIADFQVSRFGWNCTFHTRTMSKKNPRPYRAVKRTTNLALLRLEIGRFCVGHMCAGYTQLNSPPRSN